MNKPNTTVYVDSSALDLPGRSAAEAPSAERSDHASLGHLRETGHDVIVVQDGVELPPEAAGWLITRDPEACIKVRGNRRVRTILVGPAVSGKGLAHRPSDVEARDLAHAVLAILTEEAMPPGHGRGGSTAEVLAG